MGTTLIALSEILPWYGDFSAVNIAIIADISYFLPIFASIFVIMGVLLGFFSPKNRIVGIFLQIFGLGVVLIFLFVYLANNLEYFGGAQTGVYVFVTGMLIIFFEVIWSLILVTQNQ